MVYPITSRVREVPASLRETELPRSALMPTALLPNIPLVESPLFPLLQRQGVFGRHQELAAQLHEQGYALIDLGRERMAALAEAIRAALEPGFDLQAWRQNGGVGGLRIQDAWQQVEAVKQLALEPRVLEVLEQLYGRRPFAFQTLNFPVGTQQHLHSDAVHFHSEPAGFMCGVWVALEDIHPDAGPLEYVAGSQRLPYLQAHDVGVSSHPAAAVSQEIFHQAWTAMIEAQGLQRQVFLPRLGEALIWSANLLHGGSAVADPARSRWSQVTHYFFEGCRHYTPLLSCWPEGPVAWRKPLDVATGQPRGSNQPTTSEPGPELPLEQRLQWFDPQAYLKAHPDVAAAGVNAYEHLIRHGLQEGRAWR